METLAAKLDAAIKAVCPIRGVSIGRKNDKATWRIDFKDEATDKQRADARAVLEAFDPVANERDEAAKARITAIESTITQRRLREALLTPEGKDWLAAKDAEIAAERTKR